MLPVKLYYVAVEKGVFLVWPQRCAVYYAEWSVGSFTLICAAGTVLANVISAMRSFDEEGRGHSISCAGHFSVFS